MQDMRDLYRAYSAVHDTTIKEELDISKDQITTMNLGQLTESDLVEICEEIVEGLFQYGCDLDAAYEVVGSMMEATVEGELPAHRQEKIVRISESFDKVFEKVATRAERNCEEEFLKYRTNKPLTEKWNNKVSHENGNEKLHAALIHKDREIIKGGLIEMLSDIMELWSNDKQEDDIEGKPTQGLSSKMGSPGKKKEPEKNRRMAASSSSKDPLKKMQAMNKTSKGLDRIGTAVKSVQDKPEKKTDDDAAAKRRAKLKAKFGKSINTGMREEKDSSYLETDMKKREKNNEKARKDMEKVKGQKNPHFEEVSTLRQGWTNAYASIYEKKMDPVGQEDGDIDNDGDKDSSDKYLAKRRKAIGKAMKEEGEIRYPTEPKKKFTKDKSDPKVAAGRKAAKEMGLNHNEGYQELSRDKRNTMFRKAGNLSRTALQGGDKGTEAHKKSGKIVKALNRDAEKYNRNDVRSEDHNVEGYKPFPVDKVERKLDTVHDGKGSREEKNRRVGKMDGELDTAKYLPDVQKKIATDAEKKNRAKGVKKEEVSFSETELKAFEQIVNSWVD